MFRASLFFLFLCGVATVACDDEEFCYGSSVTDPAGEDVNYECFETEGDDLSCECLNGPKEGARFTLDGVICADAQDQRNTITDRAIETCLD